MDPAETPPPEPPRPARSRWRRFAPLALLAGGALAFGQLSSVWPTEREVELKVHDPRSVTRVELAWLRADEPIQGGQWSFDLGKAPPSIRTTLRLASGDYQVDVVTERRTDASTHAERAIDRRTVTLADATHLSLAIR